MSMLDSCSYVAEERNWPDFKEGEWMYAGFVADLAVQKLRSRKIVGKNIGNRVTSRVAADAVPRNRERNTRF